MAQTELNSPSSFNREVVLDLTLQAFYIYEFDHSDVAPVIHDYIPISKTVKEDTPTIVLDNSGNTVVDGAGVPITVITQITTNRTRESRRESFKFLTTQDVNITLSEYKDFNFTDWVSFDSIGFNYDSILITGYDVSADFMRKKQSIYLLVFCKRTETIYSLINGVVTPIRPSSCQVQSRWEWNDSPAQGKWGTQFEAYRLFLPQDVSPSSGDPFNYGPLVVETKNKLRGSGKALSLCFKSSTNKDMILLGWGILGYKVDEP